MRLVNFHADDGVRIGVVNGDDVIDLTSVDAGAPRDIQAVIADDAFQAVQSIADKATDADMRKFDSLSFALPVSSPGKILCLGLNYMEHVNEGIFEKQPFPTVFMRTATSMIAHNEPLIRPSVSETLDFEAELALIVGKRSRHLTEENALDAVAGYSCANDGSVREFQRHTIQWTMGKNFDNTGPFGPVFVTADELPAGAKGLNIECRLNGQTVQSSNTDMMMFPVVETLVYITQGLTLEPGDVILMGTPSGVGHARKPPLWMKDGDVVEVEIEQVGLLRNTIKDEA
ncbi:MAG: fumarylacetoacetate hydrolase family protein [Candidatus Puniceispirillaceae bacterium]|jgi:acylpyruvate hydrolase